MSADPSARSLQPASIAGAILLVITLLAVVAMAHHPTVGTALGTADALDRITAFSRSTALIHGALIVLMLLTLYCLSEFAMTRGFARPLIRAGAIAYAAGVLVMIGAALVSGFVIADVGSLMPRGTPIELQIDRQLLIFCGILNQACANVAVCGMSIGIGLWSLDLLRERGLQRLVGVLGCVVALVPIVGLPSGAIHLDVHGMLAVVLLQALWNLAIGGLLLRFGAKARAPRS